MDEPLELKINMKIYLYIIICLTFMIIVLQYARFF